MRNGPSSRTTRPARFVFHDSVPVEAREGDVLVASDEAVAPAVQSVRLTIDPTGRDQRLADANRLRGQLPRGPKGDLSL
jgi:hypothetical protein